MEEIPTVSQEIEREAHVSIEMENINIASQDTEIEDDSVPVPSIKEMLERLPALSAMCCIYRVPKKLRNVNAEAYTPQVVSIGPFHLGEKHLQAMEEHKLRYLKAFLNRTGQSLEACVKVVRRWEKRARGCYAETIDLSSDEFVKMILVDGSFIVEFLLRFFHREFRVEIDRIFDKPRMLNHMLRDLVLLENQLPFFVLEGFFEFVHVSNLEGNTSFLDLTYHYFNSLLKLNNRDTIFNPGIEHFLDFIHRCYLSSFSKNMCEGNGKYERPPSATELDEAGVKFKVGTSNSLLDIKFTNGTLKIPHLVIWDQSETLFRNLIAFEDNHCYEKFFIDYMYLLDGMINNPKDVDLLIQHGIIENQQGSSEDVSAIFNNIVKEVFGGQRFYFSHIRDDLKKYCKIHWHKWKATLKHDYFNTPWAIVSVIAAVVLLALTIIQTIFSIISH